MTKARLKLVIASNRETDSYAPARAQKPSFDRVSI